VTGASTGIGRATALALADRGWRVYAGVRKQSDADDVAASLGSRGKALLFDITDVDAVHGAIERIRDTGPLHAVVNNAGVAVGAPLEFLRLDDFRHQLEVNLIAQLGVAQAALPALRETRGRLLFVGSIGGRLAGPLLGAYHASKFALVGLTDSLRAELRPAGVGVILVEPGVIATEIWSRGVAAARAMQARLPAAAFEYYGPAMAEALRSSEERGGTGLAPARAASVIVRALEAPRPKPRYLIGRDARVLAAVALLPDRMRASLVARRMQPAAS